MEFETIETDKFIMRIYDDNNYLEYVIKGGVTIDADDVIEGQEKNLQLSGREKKFFVLAKA